MWKGNYECKVINYLVNWERVCTLKVNGGLGIIDLDLLSKRCTAH